MSPKCPSWFPETSVQSKSPTCIYITRTLNNNLTHLTTRLPGGVNVSPVLSTSATFSTTPLTWFIRGILLIQTNCRSLNPQDQILPAAFMSFLRVVVPGGDPPCRYLANLQILIVQFRDQTDDECVIYFGRNSVRVFPDGYRTPRHLATPYANRRAVKTPRSVGSTT